VRLTAYAAHPERFTRGVPRPAVVPNAVDINPPKALDDASGEREPPPGGPRSGDTHVGPRTEPLVH
jgi:hypothetical protein